MPVGKPLFLSEFSINFEFENWCFFEKFSEFFAKTIWAKLIYPVSTLSTDSEYTKTIARRSRRSKQKQEEDEEEGEEKPNATWKWHKAILTLNRALSFQLQLQRVEKNKAENNKTENGKWKTIEIAIIIGTQFNLKTNFEMKCRILQLSNRNMLQVNWAENVTNMGRGRRGTQLDRHKFDTNRNRFSRKWPKLSIA